MASTHKTENLNLSQFAASDKPGWLTDYNNDMEKIDAGTMAKESYDPQGEVKAAGGIAPYVQAHSGDMATQDYDPESSVKNAGGVAAYVDSRLGSAESVDIDYFISAVSGSDEVGDGSEEKPFKTVQHAIDLIPNCTANVYNIVVANGTYNEDVSILGKTAYAAKQINPKTGKTGLRYGGIYLRSTTPNVQNASCVVRSLKMQYCEIPIVVEGITWSLGCSNWSDASIVVANCKLVTIRYCRTVTASNIGIHLSSTVTNIYNCLISNKIRGVYALLGAVARVWDNTGSGNTEHAYYAQQGGYISYGGSVPTASYGVGQDSAIIVSATGGLKN